MRSESERVVITGMGIVSPFGTGLQRYWDGLTQARSAAQWIRTFDTSGYPTRFACPVADEHFDAAGYVENPKSIKLMSRAVRFAMGAASMALADAGLPRAERRPERCGVVHGSGGVGLHDQDHLNSMTAIVMELGGNGNGHNLLEIASRHMNPLTPLKMLPNIAAAQIAIEHGLRGENHTICTACTSGTQAIGEAMRLLRHCHADVLLAGGSDAMINPIGLAGFGMLGVLSTRAGDPTSAARPFDQERDGFVMGEGSAMLVLESLEHARGRGAEIYAEILGYGCCSDAHRITDEREDGSGCVQAIRAAIDDARLPTDQIQYVNAHGTGTRMNDRTEVRALKEVFGKNVHDIAVSSTKSQIGHLIAAAGAAEAVACVLALKNQALPPTINYETPDPECDLDFVPNEARDSRIDAVLSNSFGFGGQNACLTFRRVH
jgi:3-oxoacyl-[acyl-carrier-protein] synthase II